MRYLALLPALILSSPSLAQTQVFELPIGPPSTTEAALVSVPAAGSASSPLSGRIQIPRDTLIKLRLEQEISSANAKAGDQIRFTQMDDLVIDSKVVVPAGTLWTSTITRVRPKSANRDGKLHMTEPGFDMGRGNRILLADKTYKARKESRQEFEFYLIFGTIVESPLLVATAPITVGYAIHHAIHDHHAQQHKDQIRDRGFTYDGFVRSTVQTAAANP